MKDKALLIWYGLRVNNPPVATTRIGALVLIARKARGFKNQRDLAIKAKLSTDTVSRIERGGNGTIKSLEAIAIALDYDDALAMLRSVSVPTGAKLNTDGQKIVQLLPALSPRQLKKLRDSVREMIDSDEG